MFHDEFLAGILISDRHELAKQLQHEVLFRLDLDLSSESQFDAAPDKDRAKDVNDPMEALDRPYADHNEHEAHDQRSDDPPKKDTILVFAWNFEIFEEDEKNKKIVYAQRFFNNVAGGEFERLLRPLPEVHKYAECDRERD